jgi:hypothetical protein
VRQQLANRRFGVGDHIGRDRDAAILSGMTQPENIAMHAPTSTQGSRAPEMGRHAYERVGHSWRGRRFSSFGQIEQAEARGRRDQCPCCRTVASNPLMSSHAGAGAITHHWQCEACECGWQTSFQPLLV